MLQARGSVNKVPSLAAYKDGHFYASGSINGRPVNFLVDTRATLVTVSETFAREAGLSSGIPTVFRTANGDLQGRPKHLLGGYKSFMWHAKADGSQPVFNGVQGQRVFVDIPSQTVLVQTAVDDAGDWQSELYALFKSAIQMT